MNAEYNNFLDLIKFLVNSLQLWVVLNGNLKIFKLYHTKQFNYYLSNADWSIAVEMQQSQILKWAKNNGYIHQDIFNYTIKNKHMDIFFMV